ncbi:hypothetical protein AWC38_SpisGene23822, partial [Stylophora pistillata]
MASLYKFDLETPLIVSDFVIFSGIVFPFCGGCTADESRILLFEEPIANRAIKGHVIRSSEVLSEGSCRTMCCMEPNCVSINVKPLDGGKYNCGGVVEEEGFTAVHDDVHVLIGDRGEGFGVVDGIQEEGFRDRR